MTQFAIAFTTTGNSPRAGHRFSEIVLVGLEDGLPNGQRAKFNLNVDAESKSQVKFAVVLEAMTAMIGDATLIVHDAGNWRRFLRAELKSIRRHGAGLLVNNIVDVSAWAHQRYPRQRKDLSAIVRRIGIELPANLTGLDLEAELLCWIVKLMSMPTRFQPVTTGAISMSLGADVQVIPSATQYNLIERVGKFWRSLTSRVL